jgi:hypothetical protein
MADRRSGSDHVMTTVLLAMLVLWAYSAGLVALHVFQWLRDGVWPTFAMIDLLYRLGLPWPMTEWRGIQQIIDYLMNTSVAAVAFWLGLIAMWIGGSLSEK